MLRKASYIQLATQLHVWKYFQKSFWFQTPAGGWRLGGEAHFGSRPKLLVQKLVLCSFVFFQVSLGDCLISDHLFVNNCSCLKLKTELYLNRELFNWKELYLNKKFSEWTELYLDKDLPSSSFVCSCVCCLFAQTVFKNCLQSLLVHIPAVLSHTSAVQSLGLHTNCNCSWTSWIPHNYWNKLLEAVGTSCFTILYKISVLWPQKHFSFKEITALYKHLVCIVLGWKTLLTLKKWNFTVLQNKTKLLVFDFFCSFKELT